METDEPGFTKNENDLEAYLSSFEDEPYEALIISLPVAYDKKYETGLALFRHKIPSWIFIFITLYLAVFAFKNNASLIPLLGLTSCLYMMSELGYKNWIYFLIWLAIGLVIYFGFSYKNSKLGMRV